MPVLEDALRGVAEGDRESMARFYDSSAGLSWKLALAMSGDPTRVVGIVTATYRDVWLDATEGVRSTYTAQTWVLTLVHHHALTDLGPAPRGGVRGVAAARRWLLDLRTR